MSDKIKVAVIGVGYLGRAHARVFSELEGIELVGVSDTDKGKAEEVARQTGSRPFLDYSELFGNVDAVSIVVPTELHHKVASDFLKEGIDIFIEKPIAADLNDAEDIVRTAKDKDLILQVGHIERFNPGYIALKGLVQRPRFIEAQRLSPFSDRGTDVDVSLDLMIHDIDIILSLVDSRIKEIKASGLSVLTPLIDMANARIEFEDGCVANLTASRISHGKTRRLRIFEPELSLTLDYQNHEVIVNKKVSENGKPLLRTTHIKPDKGEPLKDEIRAFIESAKKRLKPIVSGVEATEALKVALKVSEIIKNL